MRTARSSSRPEGLHQAPPQSRPPPGPGTPPPRSRVNRMTDRCKNITLPQTSFAGGNNVMKNCCTGLFNTKFQFNCKLLLERTSHMQQLL